MNYEFKGTPGSWISCYDDNGFYFIVDKEAKFPSPYISATGGENELEKANSLLQSKAPEMFEMLKRAKKMLEYPAKAWQKQHIIDLLTGGTK